MVSPDNDSSVSERIDTLEGILQNLNDALEHLADDKADEFNQIIYSIKPLDTQLHDFWQYIDSLKQSCKLMKDELFS